MLCVHVLQQGSRSKFYFVLASSELARQIHSDHRVVLRISDYHKRQACI